MLFLLVAVVFLVSDFCVGIETHSLTDSLDSCGHFKYRQRYPNPGFHILCFKYNYLNDVVNTSITIHALVDGMDEMAIYYDYDVGDDIYLYRHLFTNYNFGKSNGRTPPHWQVFSTRGKPIYSVNTMLYEETVFLFTNGLWLWPGVEEGYTQYTQEGYKLTTISLRPLVFEVEGFLTDDECEHIRSKASPHMIPSSTSKMDHDVDLPDTTWRTSTQVFLTNQGDSVVENIDRKVAKLTNTNTDQQEYVQVLRYEKGQFYSHHTDYFDPSMYQNDENTLRQIDYGNKNRFITVLWYLSNIEGGGETAFTHPYNSTSSSSDVECALPLDAKTSIKVVPKKRNAIIFYSLTGDGGLDYHSVHAACPVIGDEEKWAANKWIWSDQWSV